MSPTASLDAFVLSAIARACEQGEADVGPDSRMEDLQIDSLRMVAIVGQVEQEFATKFHSDAVLEFFLAERVEDLVGIMRGHM